MNRAESTPQEGDTGKEIERVRALQHELVERRRRVVSKLSPKDQEELATVDQLWQQSQEQLEDLGYYDKK